MLPGQRYDEAVAICEAARDRVARHPWYELATGLRVTVGVGVGHCVGRPNEVERLVGEADTLLYTAKQAGRNAVASREARTDLVRLAGAAGGRRVGPPARRARTTADHLTPRARGQLRSVGSPGWSASRTVARRGAAESEEVAWTATRTGYGRRRHVRGSRPPRPPTSSWSGTVCWSRRHAPRRHRPTRRAHRDPHRLPVGHRWERVAWTPHILSHSATSSGGTGPSRPARADATTGRPGGVALPRPLRPRGADRSAPRRATARAPTCSVPTCRPSTDAAGPGGPGRRRVNDAPSRHRRVPACRTGPRPGQCRARRGAGTRPWRSTGRRADPGPRRTPAPGSPDAPQPHRAAGAGPREAERGRRGGPPAGPPPTTDRPSPAPARSVIRRLPAAAGPRTSPGRDARPATPGRAGRRLAPGRRRRPLPRASARGPRRHHRWTHGGRRRTAPPSTPPQRRAAQRRTGPRGVLRRRTAVRHAARGRTPDARTRSARAPTRGARAGTARAPARSTRAPTCSAPTCSAPTCSAPTCSA